MLRITRHDQEVAAVTLKLEGRLTGPWSQELDRVAGDATQGGTALVLDLSDLMFVDTAGVELLRTLGARGASFRGGSSFVTALLYGDHP